MRNTQSLFSELQKGFFLKEDYDVNIQKLLLLTKNQNLLLAGLFNYFFYFFDAVFFQHN